MLFRVEPNSAVPIYRQLAAQVRAAVASGRLRPGQQLPSLRAVAGELVINHLTVKQAYHLLEQQGLIQTRRGRGTYVCAAASTGLREQIGADLHEHLRELASMGRGAGLTEKQFLKLAREAWNGPEQAP